MALRSFNHQSLQNYPKIQIDRGSVIKPCVADQTAADQFIDKPVRSWKKILLDVWHEGVPFILRYLSNLRIPVNSNTYYTYFVKFIKYIAALILHIHQVYLYIYGYFYPYSLMSLDAVCDEFSRCPKWSDSVIRAFSWHPNQDRCAVAICNDYIYVYQGATRIRVFRHNHQRKIVDMAWQPSSKDVLVVATQTNIIIWRVIENQIGHLVTRDGSRNANFNYLAPGIHLIKREKESQINGRVIKSDSLNNSAQTDSNNPNQVNGKNFKLLENVLPAPIVCVQFDQSGEKAFACSPNSSKIAIINVEALLNSNNPELDKPGQHIQYLRRYGQGVTKLLWSPTKNRLATSTTSSFFRVFEPFNWTCSKWSSQGTVQEMIWSKPSGRMLLITNKTEAAIYALPFLDEPQAKDVGGNKSVMKALDVSATRGELDDMVGGRVQSFAWDKNGKRLAIMFKDNPESILLYRTVERPTVEFHQLGVIRSDSSSIPLLMEFHDKFQNGSLLTICWSDGNVQHVPLSYLPQEQTRNGLPRDDGFNNSINQSMNSFNEPNSPPQTPRSLTNFCHVSGTSGLSPYPSSLGPINKVQHHTTLYSLSTRSPLAESNDSNVPDS